MASERAAPECSGLPGRWWAPECRRSSGRGWMTSLVRDVGGRRLLFRYKLDEMASGVPSNFVIQKDRA